MYLYTLQCVMAHNLFWVLGNTDLELWNIIYSLGVCKLNCAVW